MKSNKLFGLPILFSYLIVTIFPSFIANPSMANTYCVANEADLIAALNEAKVNGSDDVIKIQQGTYNGNFFYASTESFGVTIEGGYSVGCASRVVDPDNTVLDAEGSGAVLVLSSPNVAANYNIDGLTLQNGKANHYGGGLYVLTDDGSINVENTNIINNEATHGGGVDILGDIISINTSTISSNYSPGPGGGIFIGCCATIVHINNSDISNNRTNTHAGGILIDNVEVFSLTNSRINNNSAGNRDGGGGLHLSVNDTITISNNEISYNYSPGKGGALALPGVTPSIQSKITIDNNEIIGNIAQGDGGGLWIYFRELTLTKNIIQNNETNGQGGGLLIKAYKSDLINNIINNNIAGDIGGGLRVKGPIERFNMINNTVFNNTSTNAGGGIFLLLYFDSAIGNIFNNIIFNNISEEGSDLYLRNDDNNNYLPSTVNLFNNDFDQSSTGTYIQLPFSIDPSNLNNEDPLFVDPLSADYHLTGSSPCIDVGSNSVSNETRDIEGNKRFMDGDQNGTVVVDIGAYEFGNTNQCTGHFDQDGDVDGSDLSLFAAELTQGVCDTESQCTGDYNADGFMDSGDLNVFVSYFGQSECLSP